MPQPILLVEDEPEILELLVFTLTRAGYETLEAGSAETAQQILHHTIPSLAVLDWMLPGMTGIDLAHRLRQEELTRHLPIIMLTARGEESDKLRSFDSGVDDYITKPFSPKELIARIRALLRRSGAATDNVLEACGIRFELDSHRVTLADKEAHLGPTEYRLLEFFVGHPGRAFSREQLLDRVWGRSVYVEERTVDVHILRLRKVLKQYGLEDLLQTVRGFGYRFGEVPFRK